MAALMIVMLVKMLIDDVEGKLDRKMAEFEALSPSPKVAEKRIA